MPPEDDHEAELSAEQFGTHDLVRVLIGHGDLPDPQENQTISWLCNAIYDGDYDFARDLLEHGADPTNSTPS